MSDPLLVTVECSACKHIWQGFFPDGVDKQISNNAQIECPKCHKQAGWIWDERTEVMERADCSCNCHMNQDNACHQCWETHHG